MPQYHEVLHVQHRERALYLLEQNVTLLVTEDTGYAQLRARLRPKWKLGSAIPVGYQVLDEATLEVVATRKTPKGALDAADKYVAGEKVR